VTFDIRHSKRSVSSNVRCQASRVQRQISRTFPIFFFLFLLIASPLHAQGIRDRIRQSPRGTRLSETQAADVTLTLSPVTVRPIQQIVRMGGTIDKSHKVLSGTIATAESSLIEVGQRVRSFPPESKASMYQARVTRVGTKEGKTLVEVTLSGQGIEGRVNYVMEITVDRGQYLCIPSEAIIEEGDHRVAYVQEKDGSYAPRTIETGLQGELYTQVVSGLAEGDQVVTFGSFFIDANHKLKFAGEGP
jgi:multidrug efflux pump subunit AcrA (membrane-fusion protein)